MIDDFDEEEYYTRNAIEGSAKLRDAILGRCKAPVSIVWVQPEGAFFQLTKRSIASIKDAVAEYFHISPTSMADHCRQRAVARPRQVAMFLARELTPNSLPDIGRRFGNRDHTTVIHAVRQVEKLMRANAAFAADVKTLRDRLAA
jgi:hypothetical protein